MVSPSLTRGKSTSDLSRAILTFCVVVPGQSDSYDAFLFRQVGPTLNARPGASRPEFSPTHE
jgi:hypothetical protein